MEKEEDGAVANKAACKCRSRTLRSVDDSSRNPDEDLEVNESKRKKESVEPVMSLGHSNKLSDRLILLLFTSLYAFTFYVCSL